MSLLPSSGPTIEVSQEGDIQLFGVENEQTELVFEALGSDTARSLYREITREAGTPSELAERIDHSVQTVSYHLNNLQEAELIEVAGTRYSEKGKEMEIYAPADEPILVFVGTESRRNRFRKALGRLLGGVGILTIASVMFTTWVGGIPFGGQTGGAPPTQTPGPPPGIAFFLGGFLMLLIFAAIGYWNPTLQSIQQRIVASSRLSGVDKQKSRRVALGSVGLFVLSSGLWFVQGVSKLHLMQIGPFDILRHGLFIVVLFATLTAYWNDGLLLSWAVTFASIAGIASYGVGQVLVSGDLALLVGGVSLGMVGGIVGAVTLGSIGYGVGIGIRRAIGRTN